MLIYVDVSGVEPLPDLLRQHLAVPHVVGEDVVQRRREHHEAVDAVGALPGRHEGEPTAHGKTHEDDGALGQLVDDRQDILYPGYNGSLILTKNRVAFRLLLTSV